MKKQTFRGVMKANQEFIQTMEEVDLYPRFLGVLRSGGKVHGLMCWWSRYAFVDGKRRPIHPKIGIALKGKQEFVDVFPDQSLKRMTGTYGLFGHEVAVILAPHGKGDDASISVTVMITGIPYRHAFDDNGLPAEYFFRSGD